jgi:poly(hydroxyalkanoate) depolymerase family esterase
MDDRMYAAMVEATRLTNAGRLAEATALIQRSLGLTPMTPGAAAGPTDPMAPASEIRTEPRAALMAPARDAGSRDASPPTEAQPRPRAAGSMAEGTPAASRRPGISSRRPGRRPARRPIPHEAIAPAAGRWIAETHTDAAGTRAYQLYVPGGHRGRALPLLVMLHGCTQSPDDFAAGTAMNFLAESDGLLVAYPEQAAAANASGCWNWFRPADQRRDHGEPALIAGITRRVMAEYHVDAGGVYVAGLSAGGAMAAIVAAAYPELYAAVGVHSGLAPGSAHDLPSALHAMRHGVPGRWTGVGPAVPLLVVQGDRDATVHPSNADHLVRQWLSASGSAARDGAAPSMTERAGRVAGGRSYTCATYRDARGRVLVERWTILGAGHAWSGGSQYGSYTDPGGPEASRELVRFFGEHPRGSDVPPSAD